MDDIKQLVGGRIRSAREVKGLLQRELAEMIGVVQTTVCNWEKGHRDLTATQTVKVCRALGVTPDYLFGFTTLRDQGDTFRKTVEDLRKQTLLIKKLRENQR